jgi:hypothetical protein
MSSSVCLRHSTELHSAAALEPTGAEFSRSLVQKSKSVKQGLRRALTIVGHQKPKEVKAVKGKNEEKKEDDVVAVQVDYGSTFNLLSIVKTAHQSSKTQEFAEFLQPAVIADSAPRRSAPDAKRTRIALSSIVDLSGADWDAERFYAGDLASVDIYWVDWEPPVVNTEPESLCGGFGTYHGSGTARQRMSGHPARYWRAGYDQKRTKPAPLPVLPARSPLRNAPYAPVRAEPRTETFLEKESSVDSLTANHTGQEEPTHLGGISSC